MPVTSGCYIFFECNRRPLHRYIGVTLNVTGKTLVNTGFEGCLLHCYIHFY
nr:MAG TPA: UvrABC system protein C [Caudoviricetes sp.]